MFLTKNMFKKRIHYLYQDIERWSVMWNLITTVANMFNTKCNKHKSLYNFIGDSGQQIMLKNAR